MHGNVANAGNGSTKSNAANCSELHGSGVNCTDLQGPLWFALLCRHIAKPKPWLMLMETCGYKERTAHNYVAGHSKPDVDALRDLLWSPLGYRTLKFIMEGKDNPPAWWDDFQMVVREMTARLGRLE